MLLFQKQMRRLLQKFITKIIFAEMTKIPEDLLNVLIAFSLNKLDTSPNASFLLFQESGLYTPELRCITLEQVFRSVF